jgi:SAM-dependent methyltransferase
MTQSCSYEDENFARFYDWEWDAFDADLGWYLELARHNGSPVLEIACGTGRVDLPLARAGFEVVGLDLSEPMLALARRKTESEPENVKDAVSFIQADMRHFQLGRTFPCVFVPNGSFFHLRNSDALRECVACLFSHTQSGGVLTIDLVAPHRMANQEVGNLRLVGKGVNPLTGLMTEEYNRKLEIDTDRQVVRVEHVYIEQDQSEKKRYEFIQDYRWIQEEEGRCLLSEGGFIEIKTFGDYNASPFSESSPRLIFQAQSPKV